MKRTLRVVRRDEHFHDTYQRTLRDVEERLSKLSPDERYKEAYRVLRGFLETLLDACKRVPPRIVRKYTLTMKKIRNRPIVQHSFPTPAQCDSD